MAMCMTEEEYEYKREKLEKKLNKKLSKLERKKDKLELRYNLIIKALDNRAYNDGLL